MGILNVTPDSFSDGGRYADVAAALDHALAMARAGARIIDVGGESTRPGAGAVPCEEELARTVPVVRALAERNLCVSIDTRHAEVARACIRAGASIINDVSGFRDPGMVEVAAEGGAGVVVMHMQGTPATMQDAPCYTDVVAEVAGYLDGQARMLQEAGVAPARICIDPGPGFGKTVQQTTELVRNIQEFARLGYPVMAALSRKAFIGHLYGLDVPSARDEASAQEALMAVELGAGVVRTHNVACTCAALREVRPYCFLGLGSNVALVGRDGEEREAKIALLNQVIAALVTLPDTQLVDISGFYESEPAYLADQPPFVNAAVLIRTGLPPRELLACAHAIEDTFGRIRTVKNGPRTCDIDILDYQLYVCETDTLTLPHPLLHERGFVVDPLLELRPNHVLADGRPVRAETVRVGQAHRCP